MRKSTRPIVAAALAAVALTLAACGGAAPTPAPPPASAVPGSTTAAEIPATQAGAALSWVLDASRRAPVPDAEITAHVSAQMLAQIPVEGFNTFLKDIGDVQLGKVSADDPNVLSAEITSGATTLDLLISVDAAGLLDGLQATPPPTPQPTPVTWAELDERLAEVAPKTAFLAAEILPDGSCKPAHTVAADEPRPLGSMFKLYILGSLAEQIKAGALTWDTPLTVTPETMSLTQKTWTAGQTITVLDAAKLMISISDNTATDLLLAKAGRENVEAVNHRWSPNADRNTPFLSTRELFTLKHARYPELTDKYLALDTAGRRALLADVVDPIPTSDIAIVQKPVELDRIEWFASPTDIGNAHAALRAMNDPSIDAAMSVDDGSLGFDRGQWPSIWYKGGSEVGLMTLGFSARTADGRTFMVTAMSQDNEKGFVEAQHHQELVALVRGGFTLAKG